MLISCITSFASANYTSPALFYNTLTAQQDTLPSGTIPITDTLPQNETDTGANKIHKIDTINIKVSKDSLDAPVSYAASDSMVLDVQTKKIRLYNKAVTKYKDLDLSAYQIELDQERQLVIATHTLDTVGQMVGRPKFIQGANNFDSDSITYNFKTQKGITNSTYTTQGEMFVYGEKIKKFSENEYFAYMGRFTTCNYDTPHFAFVTKKLKLVNKKLAISGPIHPEFEGVPVPVYIPFGFFPLAQGRHSGLLPPQFTANQQFGVGLEGLGYYKVLSDNFDVTLRSNIYSYGGYNLFITPTYRKRYRYQGQFNFAYQNTRFLSDAGIKEYESNKSFNIYWNHQVDSKARPGSSFSANVNAGSTRYNRYVTNNPMLNYQNQLSSSINYSRSWDNKYNLNVTANHNQNNNTRLVNLSLPNVTFAATTVYPFQRKEFVGEPKWYEKLGVGFNSNIGTQASFYDSLFSLHQLIDTFQWGANHNIPITLSLPALGPLQIAPGISYQEKWYGRKFYRKWDGKKVDTLIEKGFYTARDVSFSLGVNTALFGTFNFGKKSNVKAIRHVVRPTLSFNYKPDLAKKDFYSVQVDSVGRQYRFSPYDGSIFGAFGEGRFGGIAFGIDNNLEMKVRSKSDTAATADRKVKLIDGFGFNSGYNLMADSFNLSPFNLYLRSTLFENINITAGAVIDPYGVDENGFRTNQYTWQGQNFSPGRLTNGNLAISTSFRSKEKKETKKDTEDDYNDQMPMTMEDQQAQLNYIQRNPAEFADFNIPWSINVSYS
ncbi:MAG TPA: putative LPS assembly protein LptD, partial [Chitinophagaceae bacterium]|nr:putative LPS assembly protein LptD [Chitinophagaceae bacterium]